MDEKTKIQCLELQIDVKERVIELQCQEIASLRGKVEAYERVIEVFGNAFDYIIRKEE